MDPQLMAHRAPHSPLWATGWLEGWRLTFAGEDLGWEGSLATVVEDSDSKVFVVLYDMTPEDEHNLDQWEHTELGIYQKIRAGVSIKDKVDNKYEIAWLYTVNGFEGGLPSKRYIQTMAFAAKAAGAPDDYVEDLLSRPAKPLAI